MYRQDNEHIQILDKDNEPIEHVLKSSKCARKEKTFDLDFVFYLVEGTQKTTCYHSAFSLRVEIDPLTFEVVMNSQEIAF